ncbi:MAG TPA: hypothetical protein PLJ44_00535 [Victivallales bacterium]|nr:hypothetical protein [Victivallales bacterium]
MRTISSSCSMIAMTLFFLSFLPEISLLPFSITISLWASTYIVSPPAQFGNINLFAFSITLLSAIPFLRKITLNRYLLFLITLIWISQIRDEYYLPLMFLIIYGLYQFLWKKDNSISGLKKQLYNSSYLLFFLIFSVSYLAFFKKEISEHNLSLCFGQHYATFYMKKHPEMTFSAMTEYQDILKQRFNGRTNFLSILLYDPIEVAKYFIMNGIRNSFIMIPAIFRQRICIIFPEKRKFEIIQLIFLFIMLLPGFVLFFKNFSLSSINFKSSVVRAKLHEFLVSLIIASAVIVPMFLLIPDSRYYSPFAPICFIGVYYLFNNAFKVINSNFKKIIAVAVTVCFLLPLIGIRQTNQNLIKSIRQHYSSLKKNQKPLFAGLSPSDIAVFSFGINYSIEPNHLLVESVLSKKYDFIVINKYFRLSSIYAKNEVFMQNFERFPELYSYSFIGKSFDKHETTVFAKKN